MKASIHSNFSPPAEGNQHFLMIETVKKILGIGKKNTGIKLIVSCERLEKRVALLENNRLEEYTTERESDRNIVGAIYKGKVRNIEQGIKAMFVDIGFEKNAFLQFWDAIPAALDSGVEAVTAEGKKKGQKITHKDVPKIYPAGSDILVQVKKGPIGNKGPRITTDVSLAGRYLVLMPFNDQCGISERSTIPRTRPASEGSSRSRHSRWMGRHHSHGRSGQRARYFVRDLSLLLQQWEEIQKGAEELPAPVCLFQEPISSSGRCAISSPMRSTRSLSMTSKPGSGSRTVGQISSRAKKRIQLYTGSQPIFDCFGVQAQIDAAFQRQGGCRAAATSLSMKPRRSSPWTSTPDATRARRTSRRRSCKPILRPRTKSAAKCASAISVAESSSPTSST